MGVSYRRFWHSQSMDKNLVYFCAASIKTVYRKDLTLIKTVKTGSRCSQILNIRGRKKDIWLQSVSTIWLTANILAERFASWTIVVSWLDTLTRTLNHTATSFGSRMMECSKWGNIIWKMVNWWIKAHCIWQTAENSITMNGDNFFSN